jgi:ribonuclease HII
MIGIDEVGRGCWAGPLLVVAARQNGTLSSDVKDSKKLTSKKRKALVGEIMMACDIGEGWVSAREIDEVGLGQAMRLGVDRALQALACGDQESIIMDGSVNYCSPKFTNVQVIIKADAIHPVVSAASIYAKVVRDAYMAQQAESFPDYGFEKHVGYGTSLHAERLAKHGPSQLHRYSFKPVRVIHELHITR